MRAGLQRSGTRLRGLTSLTKRLGAQSGAELRGFSHRIWRFRAAVHEDCIRRRTGCKAAITRVERRRLVATSLLAGESTQGICKRPAAEVIEPATR